MKHYIFFGLNIVSSTLTLANTENIENIPPLPLVQNEATKSLQAVVPNEIMPPPTPLSNSTDNTYQDTCIQHDDAGRFLGWIDNQHCFLSTQATQTAQWLDGLFAQQEDTQHIAKGRIRIINDFAWLEGDGLSASVRIRASLKLPNAKRRFHLVISDEADTLNAEHKPPVVDNESYQTSAAIRWIPDVISRVKYSVDIGAHATDIFARFRAQRAWQVSDNSTLRFRQLLRYGLKSETKAVSELETERLLSPSSVLRLGASVQYWQNEPKPVGLRWSQSNSILHRISRHRSIAYGVTVDGVQQPHWQVANDRLFVLYRQSVWRSWLYYELEPQLVRDWTTDKSVKTLFVFRLEANVGG